MPVALQIVSAIVGIIVVSYAQLELNKHGVQILLTIPVQVVTAIWAGWDSHKQGIPKYKTAMSMPPFLISIFCMLVWMVAFPLYLYARNKVVTGQAQPKDNVVSIKQQSGRALKLLIFTIFAVALGAGVLLCLFAPSINPTFIEGVVFQALNPKLEAGILHDASGSEKKYLSDTFQSLNHPFNDDDINKLGIPKPQDVTFKAKDGSELHGWFFEKPGGSDTILFSPSGFGDARLTVYLGYIKALTDANLSVFIYDYRGVDSAIGQPHLQTAAEDGHAALAYLVDTKHVDPARLIFMGRDLGAFVSCDLCNEAQPKAMILEEPWTSLKRNFDAVAPAMSLVPAAFYPLDGLDNMHVLEAEHHVPVLIIGTGGPRSESFKIFEKIGGSKSFLHLISLDAIVFPDLREQSGRLTKRVRRFIDAPPAAVAAARDGGTASGTVTDDSGGSVNDSQSTTGGTAASTKPATVAPIKWLGTLAEAQTAATAQKKFVLIDVYTDWCGWCKKLDRDTYPDPAVAQYLNSNYICLKVNAEDKGEGQSIAQKFNVRSFPNMIILDGAGKIVGKIHGYLGPTAFLEELKSLSAE